MEEDRALANMERAIRTPATKVVYLHRLGEYKVFSKAKTFDGLLTKTARATENNIVAYVDHQKNRGLSAKTIRLCVSAIRLFFVSNRKALNWEWIRSMVPAVDTVTEDRLYTKEEIKQIYDHCDDRKKAMFLLLFSSGARIGALPSMKIGDLEPIPKIALLKTVHGKEVPEE